MNALQASTNDITSDTKTISSLLDTSTFYSPTYPNKTTEYSESLKSTSDVNYQTQDESISVLENNNSEYIPNLSCSTTGSTSISYSIGDYSDTNLAPDWVSINSSSGVLTIKAPNVSSDTEYYFYINSKITGVSNPIKKLIKLTVLNCIVVNWNVCSSTSGSSWNKCSTGFNLSSGVWLSSSSGNSTAVEKSPSIIIQVFVGLTLVVTLISSYMGFASISWFWSMVNQLQLFFLLILTRSHMPDDVIEAITGAKIALNFPGLFHLQDSSAYKSVFQNAYFELSNPTFSSLDLYSECVIYNISPLLILIFLILLIFVLLYLLNKQLSNWNMQNVCPKIVQLLKYIGSYSSWVILSKVYIRFIILMNLYILLSAAYEINYFKSSSWRAVSLLFTIWIIIWLILLIVLIFYLSSTTRADQVNYEHPSKEFFRGIKKRNEERFYVFVQFMRRIYFVILLVFYPYSNSWLLILMLIIFQLMYILFLIYLHPYEETKGNIIEIMNESVFFCLLFSHFFITSENDWKSGISQLYFSIIIINVIVMFILIYRKYNIFINRCYSWFNSETLHENYIILQKGAMKW